jgi:hypothetical protein
MNLNLLKNMAMWTLAIGAVLASPVILIYSVPFAIGILTDIARLGYGPMAAVLVASAVALRWVYRLALPKVA